MIIDIHLDVNYHPRTIRRAVGKLNAVINNHGVGPQFGHGGALPAAFLRLWRQGQANTAGRP